MTERPDKPLVVVPGPLTGASANNSVGERRTTTRFPFTASAVVFDVLTKTRVVGRSGDLSLGGCYIDTMSPFPKGTAVHVSIERGPQKFEALAIVKYAPQSMGMGLAFTEIKPEHQAILRKWVAELNGEESPELEVVAEAVPESDSFAGIGTLRQVVNELINLMIAHKTITEKEGAELLRRMYQ